MKSLARKALGPLLGNRKAMSTGVGIVLAALLFISAMAVGIYATGGFNKTPGSTPSCGNGTHLNLVSGQCEANPTSSSSSSGNNNNAAAPFSGTLTLTVTSIDGDAYTALALTNAVFDLYTPDMMENGVCTQATGVDHTINPSDNGKAYLVVEYLTDSVGYVDPAKTLARNKSFMQPGSMFLKDVNNDGQLDQVYPVDFSWLTVAGSTGKAIATISLVAWHEDNAVTLTAATGGSPTGMHTAGDYHATGYVAAITSTYEWLVTRIWISSNSTSTGMGSLFSAGTSYIVKFTLQGTGPQTNTVYGGTWGRQDFYNPNFDAANIIWDIYRAHNGNGLNQLAPTSATDISQINYGMPFVNERMSATTWLSFDIWIHTSGDMTSSAAYDGTDFVLHITNVNAAGTTHTDTLAYTLTG